MKRQYTFGSGFNLDNRFYDRVICEMKPFLESCNFTECEDGGFQCDTRKVKIVYNEEKQMYELFAAEVEDGAAGEYSVINSWLFDDSQNAKDAEAVGVDFTVSLRKNMGIKHQRNVSAEDAVALPSANKNGNMTVTGFTKKVLDVFPVLKDEYKAHVAAYGNFLYLSFFGEKLVPQIKELLANGNKKQIKKVYDLFEDVYIHGDNDAVNAALAVLCAAAYNDGDTYSAITEMLSANAHFSQSFAAFSQEFSKNKKLSATLIK